MNASVEQGRAAPLRERSGVGRAAPDAAIASRDEAPGVGLAARRFGSLAAEIATLLLGDTRSLPSGAAGVRARASVLHGGAGRLCRTHGFEVVVRGEVPIRPVILVANHLSYIDPVALASVVPCAAVAKGEIESWPALGATLQRLGLMFVKRDAVSGAIVLRRALRALRAGVSVLNFPEGTTTRGDRVLAFKRGVFGLALREDVPVVPVSVRLDPPELAWVGGAHFAPHYARTLTRGRSRVELDFAPALTPRSFAHAGALAAAARHAITERLAMPQH
jgi:lyso-ornithine lipid O-acyltransferase